MSSSAAPNLKPRDWDHDAFHLDEFHASATNPDTRCRLSRFSVPGPGGTRPRLGPDTKTLDAKNPLESLAVKPETAPGNPEIGIDWSYWIYAPPAVRAAPGKPKLTLFFGPPGPVMNRQGLRSIFEKSDHVLITLPGTEDRPKFGVGITPAMIDTLLTSVMGKSLGAGNWQIDVLAAYSTGFRGMNRTINDILQDSHLKDVSKLIYYDCLYRHDAPPPGQHTLHAMQKVITNSPKAKFVIYELSGNVTDDGSAVAGGVPKKKNGSYWTAWPANANPLEAKSNTVTTVNNLKSVSSAMITLGLARLVQGGLGVGYFDKDFLKARFKPGGEKLVTIIDSKLKARGQYASSKTLATSTGKTFVGEWIAPDEINELMKLASAMTKKPAPKPGEKEKPKSFLDQFRLLGWDLDDLGLGDLAHDTHVPEFGWEHLLG